MQAGAGIRKAVQRCSGWGYTLAAEQKNAPAAICESLRGIAELAEVFRLSDT
jgi:hypothetical protein